jgi:hydroxymethylpyrimidine/phosphomethylpyrimidine kinase
LSRDDGERPRALTIAGSDSGGGAGIQADLKTFAALGVYGMSAVTAVTVQNTKGVSGYEELSPQTVADQIRAVVSDIGVDAAKTGMLASAAIVEAVADAVAETRVPNLVVDPVFMSKHGHPLLADDAVRPCANASSPWRSWSRRTFQRPAAWRASGWTPQRR